MIERYRALQQSGLSDEADILARDYQDRRLGYAGVAHHFRALLATHAAQQDAALAALAALAAATVAATRRPRATYGATLPTVPRPAHVGTSGVAATAVYQGSPAAAGSTIA